MSFALTAYQTEFQSKLTGDSKTSFDGLVELANNSQGDLVVFNGSLPAEYQEMVKDCTTVEAAIEKFLKDLDWGIPYSPAVAATAKRAKRTPVEADGTVKEPKTPKAPKEPKVPKTPEELAALKEKRVAAMNAARAKRGVQSTEQKDAAKVAILAETVKQLTTAQGVVATKPLCAAVLTAVVASGVATKELDVYNAIRTAGQAEGTGFKQADMGKGRVGYQLV